MPASADLVVTNARILTMDPARPRAEALAIAGETLTAVGARADIERRIGPETRVIDAGGATVLPGFFESHLHLGMGGAELAHLQIGGMHGTARITAAVRDFARRSPGAGMLMAQGGLHTMLDGEVDRHALDAMVADRPLAIMAKDHHTVWANTLALKQAGLLNGRAMPRGHEVVLGPDRTATGELREFEAFAPIMAMGGDLNLSLGIATGGEPVPWPAEAAQAVDREKVARGLAHCARHGVTSMVNMDGNRYLLVLLDGLRREGCLTARVKVPFHMKPHMELAELARAEEMRDEFRSGWLSSNFVKMFMDGVVDSRTSFMLHDYPSHPGHRSVPLFAPDRFAEICQDIDRRGMQIAVHATGDGAVRAVIDGYEAARRANGPRDSRHRIEHIEEIDPADVPRLAELGIVASLQPGHAPGLGSFPLDPYVVIVGEAMLKNAFLCRSLAEAGAQIAFASDWPVIGVRVLDGIRDALTRGPYPGGRNECLSLPEVLHAYTASGAWTAHLEGLTGRVIPGLAGDVAVLTGDIETTAPEAIPSLDVAATIAGGRVTYGG